MKLEKNDSVKNILREIMSNIMFYTEMNEYDYQETTKDNINKLNYIYSKLGVDNKIIHKSSTFYDIPYNRDIKFNDIKSTESIVLERFTIGKNILHAFDFPISNERLKTYIPYSSYDRDIITFKIKENDNLYMAPTRMEYNTMKKEINKAHGDVLTFGLGIGFFQYMCLLKNEVKSVTIVEKNEVIISFFKEYILPQFSRATDIKIIEGDAFDYIYPEFLNQYDYTFIDIHFSNEDGYIYYKEFLKKGVDFNEVGFWIEDTILFEVKMAIALYLDNKLNGSLTELLSKDSYLKSNLKSIHRCFREEDVIIDSEEMVLKYINNVDFIRKILIREES